MFCDAGNYIKFNFIVRKFCQTTTILFLYLYGCFHTTTVEINTAEIVCGL